MHFSRVACYRLKRIYGGLLSAISQIFKLGMMVLMFKCSWFVYFCFATVPTSFLGMLFISSPRLRHFWWASVLSPILACGCSNLRIAFEYIQSSCHSSLHPSETIPTNANDLGLKATSPEFANVAQKYLI